ncbi:MAG TPA: hypothetical protein VME69_11965 [Methylocella sp.]|nr:hypothetical protein [Methylocella sp.]
MNEPINIELTPTEGELLKRILNQTILDTLSNRTARQCKSILSKLANGRPSTSGTEPERAS